MVELKDKIEKVLFNPSIFGTLEEEQKDALMDLHYDITSGVDDADGIIIPDCVKGLINAA